MDTLMSIKTFRQVIESASFVAAAERLDMSTAMVSKHVMHTMRELFIERRSMKPAVEAEKIAATAVFSEGAGKELR